MIERTFAAMPRPVTYYICVACRALIAKADIVENRCPACNVDLSINGLIHPMDEVKL